MARTKPKGAPSAPEKSAANVGFEAKLWLAADKLRSNMDAAEYKHVVLGLIFLKYISDAFDELHSKLLADKKSGADPEDPDERFLGSKGSPLGASPGERQATHHRQSRR